jgi:MGT family glycosyltransferase
VLGARTAETAKDQALAAMEGKAPPPSASMMNRVGEELEATLIPLLKQVMLIKPDMMINDFASIAAKIVAENLQIPQVKFFTTYASNHHYNLLKESFAKYDFPTTDMFQSLQAVIDNACETAQLKPLNLLKAMTEIEPHNLVFMPKSFQPLQETFDERFQFVGPTFLRKPIGQAESLIPSDPEDGPILVISLGSLFHEWPEFFRDCYKALGNTQWRVVMAIGSKLDPAELGEKPDNFMVTPYLPQVELLQRASLFITHGGMNSTMESLTYGVPMVVIPQIEEQEITAKRVHNMNLGRYLARQHVTANTLAKAVSEVAKSQDIKGNATYMQRQIEIAGGPGRAADYVESVMFNKDFVHANASTVAKFI